MPCGVDKKNKRTPENKQKTETDNNSLPDNITSEEKTVLSAMSRVNSVNEFDYFKAYFV